MPSIRDLFRYPVKGLSPERLGSVTMTAGQGFPDDRRFAIAHGGAGIDVCRPCWMPKRAFLALDSLPALAALSSRWDASSGRLEIRDRGRLVAAGRLGDADERRVLEDFFNAFAGSAARGGVRILESRGFSFTDAEAPLVSIVSHASIVELERSIGQAIDARRWRANIVIDAACAWAETTWVGKTLAIGQVRMRVVEPILRCAATCANPDSGERDINLPRWLARKHGEAVFGVYAEVLVGGSVNAGAQLVPSAGEGG